MASQSKRGAPMSTRAPPSTGSSAIGPPPVAMVTGSPWSSATARAALPQASTSLPSELKIRIRKACCALGSSSTSWSKPMPVRRSPSARATAGVIAGSGAARASSTTKSLPSPCILMKGTSLTCPHLCTRGSGVQSCPRRDGRYGRTMRWGGRLSAPGGAAPAMVADSLPATFSRARTASESSGWP